MADLTVSIESHHSRLHPYCFDTGTEEKVEHKSWLKYNYDCHEEKWRLVTGDVGGRGWGCGGCDGGGDGGDIRHHHLLIVEELQSITHEVLQLSTYKYPQTNIA